MIPITYERRMFYIERYDEQARYWVQSGYSGRSFPALKSILKRLKAETGDKYRIVTEHGSVVYRK